MKVNRRVMVQQARGTLATAAGLGTGTGGAEPPTAEATIGGREMMSSSAQLQSDSRAELEEESSNESR